MRPLVLFTVPPVQVVSVDGSLVVHAPGGAASQFCCPLCDSVKGFDLVALYPFAAVVCQRCGAQAFQGGVTAALIEQHLGPNMREFRESDGPPADTLYSADPSRVTPLLADLHRTGATGIFRHFSGASLPPSTWTDHGQLEAMVEAFHADLDDEVIALVPTTRRELTVLATALTGSDPDLGNVRILRKLANDLQHRATLFEGARWDRGEWETAAQRAVRTHDSGATELMWATHWMADNQGEWFSGEAGLSHWTTQLGPAVAAAWKQSQPDGRCGAPGAMLLDEPLLVPVMVRELAALRAGVQVTAPTVYDRDVDRGGYLNGPPPPDQVGNPLRMLLEDWHARAEDLYTTDPDTETLRNLIRGHSRAADWCEDVTQPI